MEIRVQKIKEKSTLFELIFVLSEIVTSICTNCGNMHEEHVWMDAPEYTLYFLFMNGKVSVIVNVL